MLQITEDTPPDMLAGAMDLTVHLPTGRSVKMSVERSTPMMDLLVQITTNYQLQLSGYTLQALGMAPSKEHGDTILPYKPNTPIGALDTQHIRVIPKARTMSVPKNIPPGHQPFESTFRLKVHLPRNQLFVTRVSHNVLLDDIMKKVCEEKNLDPRKYDFRHPGNLDEILDPKLTLSDYTITEIYLVQRGSLNQTFSTSDIMALRKEEERKQMHNKTGGGVFNLIFRRGKSSTGSLSSENRSISPTHSDDSRSVTPPGVQQQIITPPSEPDRPKPPQRKRRPAPKPPVEKKVDNGLTVCHSRNSSDSSGYHEASILSDNCNTSLPRRPKSTVVNEETQKILFGQHSQSTSNLSKMSVHSKSTSSLAFPSRKKKTAPPPPPPVLKSEKTETNLEEPSPVVASQPCTVAQTETPGNGQDNIVVNNTNPKPTPRVRNKPAPSPRLRSVVSLNEVPSKTNVEAVNTDIRLKQIEEPVEVFNAQVKLDRRLDSNNEISTQTPTEFTEEKPTEIPQAKDVTTIREEPESFKDDQKDLQNHQDTTLKSEDKSEPSNNQNKVVDKKEQIQDLKDNTTATEDSHSPQVNHHETLNEDPKKNVFENNQKEAVTAKDFDQTMKDKLAEVAKLQKEVVADLLDPKEKTKPPEVVALHPKPGQNDKYRKSMFDSYTRKRGFQIGTSLLNSQSEDDSSRKSSSDLPTSTSVASALNAFEFVDEIQDLDEEMFSGSLSKNSSRSKILNQLHGMHELGQMNKNPSSGSLRSVSSLPGFVGGMKKWNNVEELDDISLQSFGGRNGWVLGDTSDTESLASTNTSQRTPLESLNSVHQSLPLPSVETKEVKEDVPAPSETTQLSSIEQKSKEVEETAVPINIEIKNVDEIESHKNNELETDWHYQLPSPPKAFRDSSPVAFTDVHHESIADSVVTSPELFEKLKVVKDQSEKETVSDLTSVVSEEERPILNKLSLENLEKRKSLVYNRELATSLKMPDDERKETFSSSLANFEKTYDEVKQSSLKQASTSTLPNFKITTYNNPKQKLDIFEDDTVRSSNTDRNSKRNSFAEPTFPLQKNYIGRSMENISFRKNSSGRTPDEEFNKNGEYTFFKPPPPKTQFNIFRSESFTKEQKWVPSKPVSRSKSQVAINRYQETKSQTPLEDSLTKSNSLFDVSGLQSLGVMRQIQNKLNTPSNSTEKLDQEEPSYQKPPETKNEVQNEEKPAVRTYKYSPPSVNMGTWSERPKIPVNVKEDPDYKYSVKDTTSKLVVNSINNDIKSHNSVEIRSRETNSVSVRVGPDTNKNVSIKVNGYEPVTQNSGNVVIKIGSSDKPVLRKPLGNINTENQRPHSIAFGGDFDISRVPIVRSVEFKKPYKDYQSNSTTTGNNTSITQIGPSNNFVSKRNGYKEASEVKYSETTIKPQIEPKPVFRVNSYLQNSSAPVVRGFRNSSSDVNKTSWNQPHSFSTLPSKPAPRNFSLNAPVPFSQSNLRRTESTNRESKSVPPPAPVMPKVFPSGNAKNGNHFGDPKEQLLQAIRDFGGKKGLRAVKA